jgi:preprotein translocase subunit SecG
VNDRQFSRFLIILVVVFFLLHIPLAFYYEEFLSKWSYEIWMAFLGVILISGIFQVPNESDYDRTVQSSFLSSLILLGAKDFSEYRSKSKALSRTCFFAGLILFGILFVQVILKSKGKL